MSLWVRTFAAAPFGDLSTDAIHAGIVQRLTLLTYLFCPDEEEDPTVVAKRLRIEQIDADTLHLFCTRDSERCIKASRLRGEHAREEAAEELEGVADNPVDGVAVVQDVLQRCQESIGFQLTFSDRDTMVWPVIVAAAAHFAETTDGLIRADDCGWMVPAGNEVSVIVEE